MAVKLDLSTAELRFLHRMDIPYNLTEFETILAGMRTIQGVGFRPKIQACHNSVRRQLLILLFFGHLLDPVIFFVVYSFTVRSVCSLS